MVRARAGTVAPRARSVGTPLLKRRTARRSDTLTGLLSQQSEQQPTAEMNAKLAVSYLINDRTLLFIGTDIKCYPICGELFRFLSFNSKIGVQIISQSLEN